MLKCPLCNMTPATLYSGEKFSFIEGKKFSILECIECDVSFADPLASDKNTYEYIYSQPESIGGYERYVRYSKLVKTVSSPLDTLAKAENAYWGVREALDGAKSGSTVLEIGSGLGYLTYALNKAGFNATGLDISNNAVESAKQMYGNHYMCGDLLTMGNEVKYDYIVMTELIEHVEDPMLFISKALQLLKEGGKLILTTPNKSSSPRWQNWGSDVPPVHLWWFSERAIERIAWSLGRFVEFVDFTDFTSMFHEQPWYPTMGEITSPLPKMKANGELLDTGRAATKKDFLGVKLRYYLSYLRRRFKKKYISHRTSTMCAVIS